MAVCPTRTLLTSDSLSATVMVMWPVSTISAKPVLVDAEEDDELPVPPRLPAEVDPDPLDAPPLVEEPVEDEAADAAPDPLLADTGSPGLRLASETIVPALGATSRVSANAVWALRRLASAPSTEAFAEAIVAGDGVVVVLVCVVAVGFADAELERAAVLELPVVVVPVPVDLVRVEVGAVGLAFPGVVVVGAVVVPWGVVVLGVDLVCCATWLEPIVSATN